MKSVIQTRPEVPRVIQSIFSRFMSDMETLIPEFQKEANQECKWSYAMNPDGSYVIKKSKKGVKSKVKNVPPLQVFWEQFSGHHFLKTLESVGSNVKPKGLLAMSDRVYQFNYEGTPYIVCGDGKVSSESDEHVPDSQGLKIHIGVNQCPDDRISIYKSKPQVGRQPNENNDIKVFCLSLFLNYDFNEDDFTYTIKHYGIAWIPGGNEFDIKAGVGHSGKSTNEMRMRLKDPRLFRIHSLAFESDPQTQGSTPSDNIEHQVAELPTQ
jgi:hypothetical protein